MPVSDFIPYILSIFSNPPKNKAGYLQHLEKEKEEIKKIFDKIKASKEAATGLTVEYDFIQDDPENDLSFNRIRSRIDDFRERNTIIHYSGHADETSISLREDDIRVAPFIKSIALCEGLKVVVLNACSTQGFVKSILERTGVKAVIATTNPVFDETAMLFSQTLYQKLSEQYTLAESFTYAVSAANHNTFEFDKNLFKVIINDENKFSEANILDDNKGDLPYRAIKKPAKNIFDNTNSPATWGLYTKSDEILDWKLFQKFTTSELDIRTKEANMKELEKQKEESSKKLRILTKFILPPSDPADQDIIDAEAEIPKLDARIKELDNQIETLAANIEGSRNEYRDDIMLKSYRKYIRAFNYGRQRLNVLDDGKEGYINIFKGFFLHGTVDCCLDHLSRKITEWLDLSNVEKIYFDFMSSNMDDFWSEIRNSLTKNIPDYKPETIVNAVNQHFLDEGGNTQKDIIFLFKNVKGKSGNENNVSRILEFWTALAENWSTIKQPIEINHHIYAFIIDNNCSLITSPEIKTDKQDEYKNLIAATAILNQSFSVLPAVKPLNYLEILDWEKQSEIEKPYQFKKEVVSSILSKTQGLFRLTLREMSIRKLTLETKRHQLLSYIESEIESAKL